MRIYDLWIPVWGQKPFKLISYPPIIWIFSSLGSTAQLARFGEAWVGIHTVHLRGTHIYLEINHC